MSLYEMTIGQDGMIIFRPIELNAEASPSFRLNVPWLSQLSPQAGYAPGDCSMACVAMILKSYGQIVTVDEVSRASGLLPGFTLAAWWDAVRVAANWHVVLYHGQDLSIDDLTAELRAGRPAIAILNYQSMPSHLRYSANYNAGHFVVVVGSTSDHILIHDPFWPASQADRGAFVQLARVDFAAAWAALAPGNKLSRQALRIKS